MTRGLGLVLGTLLALTACGNQPQQATLGKNTIACKLRQDFIDMQTMIARGETDRFPMTISNALSSGACKRYLAQTDILIDNIETVSGRKYACIRVAEETSCYWMQELDGA
jgi:hypothetical protein